MDDPKTQSLSALVPRIEAERQAGKIIVTTNGTFDLLHPGHVQYLQEARSFGDLLIVAINSDASVKRLKGPTRPIYNASERAFLLSALSCVSFVTIFEEDTPLHLLEKLRPHIHIKGGSFDPIRIGEEKRLLESWGGQFVALDLIPGYATSLIIQRVLKTN